MRIPAEIAGKAARYRQAQDEADRLYGELKDWFHRHVTESLCFEDFSVTEDPEGTLQEDGTYFLSYRTGEDSGCVTGCIPIESSGRFLRYDGSF